MPTIGRRKDHQGPCLAEVRFTIGGRPREIGGWLDAESTSENPWQYLTDGENLPELQLQELREAHLEILYRQRINEQTPAHYGANFCLQYYHLISAA